MFTLYAPEIFFFFNLYLCRDLGAKHHPTFPPIPRREAQWRATRRQSSEAFSRSTGMPMLRENESLASLILLDPVLVAVPRVGKTLQLQDATLNFGRSSHDHL
jgi:hypothetical protein